MTTHLFPTADEMRGWLAPVVVDAAEQLGSTADFYVLDPVRNADNSYSGNPAFLLNDVPIKLTEISAELAQTTFGLDPEIAMQGKMARVTPVESGMVLEVVGGDFAGRWLKVVKVIERPLSDSYRLGLADTEPLV